MLVTWKCATLPALLHNAKKILSRTLFSLENPNVSHYQSMSFRICGTASKIYELWHSHLKI